MYNIIMHNYVESKDKKTKSFQHMLRCDEYQMHTTIAQHDDP